METAQPGDIFDTRLKQQRQRLPSIASCKGIYRTLYATGLTGWG